jgi:hypothetical protein
MASIQGKKLFSFWIVWPRDKNRKKEGDKSGEDGNPSSSTLDEADIYSDVSGESAIPGHTLPTNSTVSAASASSISASTAQKDLKEIVRSEALSRQSRRVRAEQQVESHRAHDSNVSLGAKVN